MNHGVVVSYIERMRVSNVWYLLFSYCSSGSGIGTVVVPRVILTICTSKYLVLNCMTGIAKLSLLMSLFQ